MYDIIILLYEQWTYKKIIIHHLKKKSMTTVKKYSIMFGMNTLILLYSATAISWKSMVPWFHDVIHNIPFN